MLRRHLSLVRAWAQKPFRNYLHVFGGEVPALDNSEIKRCVFGHFQSSELLIQFLLCSHTRSYKQCSSPASFLHFMAPSARDGAQPTSSARHRRASSPVSPAVSPAGDTRWDTGWAAEPGFGYVRLTPGLLLERDTCMNHQICPFWNKHDRINLISQQHHRLFDFMLDIVHVSLELALFSFLFTTSC